MYYIQTVMKNNILKFTIYLYYLSLIVLLVLYLYPGSIIGYFLHNNSSIQPQITRDFLISSNHFYVFIFLSVIGILAYKNSKKINFLIKYLFLISVMLEFFHIYVPNRSFELSDLFGNIVGVIVVVVVYKIKQKI